MYGEARHCGAPTPGRFIFLPCRRMCPLRNIANQISPPSFPLPFSYSHTITIPMWYIVFATKRIALWIKNGDPMKTMIRRAIAMMAAAAILLSAPKVLAQEFESGNFCDPCDDASPRFIQDLYYVGTFGGATPPMTYPCPMSGFAQFYSLVDSAGWFVGSGNFSIIDVLNSPCWVTQYGPQTQFLLKCSDARIRAKREPVSGFPNCSYPTVWAPITAVWRSAVVEGVDELTGRPFSVQFSLKDPIATGTCPMWVWSAFVSSGQPVIQSAPFSLPAPIQLDPVRGRRWRRNR